MKIPITKNEKHQQEGLETVTVIALSKMKELQ